MFNALSSCPAPAPTPAGGTYQVLPAFNTPAATAFHQRVQAASARYLIKYTTTLDISIAWYQILLYI